MATYEEIFDLHSNSMLRNRIAVAVAVKAQGLIDAASPTAAHLTWARDALRNPTSKAVELMHYVLAANKSATVAQILSATDAAIQANVNAAVDKLAV